MTMEEKCLTLIRIGMVKNKNTISLLYANDNSASVSDLSLWNHNTRLRVSKSSCKVRERLISHL